MGNDKDLVPGAISENSAVNGNDIITKKTAASAVAFGVAILGELVGRDISSIPSENANELMASVINNELKL